MLEKTRRRPRNATPLPMPRWHDIQRLAVVGIAKNTGKTTTLNFVLERLLAAGGTPGLVSMGVDGESVDALVGIDKPPIWLPEGSLVAGAHRALEASGARIEYLDILGFETPLGEACIGRVIEAGRVVLSGMRHRGDVAVAADRLEAWGAEHVLVDGAYDRMAAAGGELCEAAVLSTGAVVGARIPAIVEKTAPWIERLQLPGISSPSHRRLLEEAVAGGEVRALGAAGRAVGSGASALMGFERAVRDARADDGVIQAVAIPGVVSESVAEALLEIAPTTNAEPAVVLARDPTVFRVESVQLWRRLTSRWKVRILNPTSLEAVTVNPTGVQGHRVDRRALVEAFESRWPGLTVFDPKLPPEHLFKPPE